MVDKAAFFGKNALNYLAGQITIDDTVAANTQAMVAGELLFEG
jgi:hypothetical protein